MPRPKQEPTATTRVFARDLEAMLKWGPTPALALRALLEGQAKPATSTVRVVAMQTKPIHPPGPLSTILAKLPSAAAFDPTKPQP